MTSLKLSKFELQTRYYIHFWTNALGKGMNPHYSTHTPCASYSLNCSSTRITLGIK